MAAAPHTRDHVASLLEGRECSHCEQGELARDQYKGSTAVVCTDCEVPQVRFA